MSSGWGTARPRHDSVDIKLLLTSYSGAWNLERLYEQAHLLEAFDFDARLAGAALLGRDTARLLGPSGAQRLGGLVAHNLDDEGHLPGDMPGRHDGNEALLAAYGRGLADAGMPVRSMDAMIDIQDKDALHRALDEDEK